MIRATITNDAPSIVVRIIRQPSSIKGTISAKGQTIKARLDAGKIKPEPYYEVSNEYGTTIVIGE